MRKDRPTDLPTNQPTKPPLKGTSRRLKKGAEDIRSGRGICMKLFFEERRCLHLNAKFQQVYFKGRKTVIIFMSISLIFFDNAKFGSASAIYGASL